MARWNIRAQVIDTGVIEMGSAFVIHNGVKVVMANGERRFLGRVIMHNEVNSLFGETTGEFVQLYLSGRGDGHLALLYGMKAENENAFRGDNPFRMARLILLLILPILLFLCLFLVGIPLVIACLWYRWHLARWDPPARKDFEAHVPIRMRPHPAHRRRGSCKRNALDRIGAPIWDLASEGANEAVGIELG